MSLRRTLAALAAAAGFAAAAAPALAQSQPDSPWNGWYLGLNAGGAWGSGSQHLSAAPGTGPMVTPPIVIPPADITNITSTLSNNKPAGFTGGIEGGYNYKYRSSGLVLGFETDFEFFDLSQHLSKTFQSALQVNPPITPTPTVTVNQSMKTDWLWTVRPKVGWVTGSWLIYGTGGMALADVKQSVSYADTFNPPNTAAFSKSATQVGWVLGAGVGYAVSSNWSVKAEYLYTDLGTISGTAATPNGYAVIGSSGKIQANIFRVGVDYRF